MHGLAYLGVLLLFVGSFGLVAFAFGDVAPNIRPLAELAIAATPFAAAALLLHRGARIAGRALELAGGLLLPIMAITSFLDGVGFPPDLTGNALVVALTTVVAAISGGYALWSARHPASALRFLVAPVAWLAVGLATTGVGRAVPSGKEVASVTAAQVMAIAAAMVLSGAAARRRPVARLSGPTLTSAVPGSVVVGLLAVLTWAAEDWPAIPVAVTGVLGLVLLDLLDVRLTGIAVGVVQPQWWAAVGLALVPALGPAPAATVAAFGFVLLLENTAARRPATWPMGLAAVGAVAALATTWVDPWWAVAAFAAAAAWALLRRLVPFPVPRRATEALDLAAAVLPAGVVVAFGLATDNPRRESSLVPPWSCCRPCQRPARCSGATPTTPSGHGGGALPSSQSPVPPL